MSQTTEFASLDSTPRAPIPTRRGRARIASLLGVAAALFCERGVEATTVDEIVARAGVAKGTFYHHFPSKAALLDALRDGFVTDFSRRILQAVSRRAPDDWPGRLEAWVAAATHAYFDMHALHDVVFHDGADQHRWTAAPEPFMRDLVGLLEAGDAAGAWSVPDCEVAALMIFHGLHGVVDDALLRGGAARDVVAPLATLAVRVTGKSL